MADRAEVISKLRTIIVDTRGVDESEVVETATLFGNLGLESIDFLEISFRMEEQFGFPFPTDDLGNLMGKVGDNSTPADVRDAMSKLRTDFHMNFDEANVDGIEPFDGKKLRTSVLKLFTVGALADYVEAKLG
jgi:acyl carrier protein